MAAKKATTKTAKAKTKTKATATKSSKTVKAKLAKTDKAPLARKTSKTSAKKATTQPKKTLASAPSSSVQFPNKAITAKQTKSEILNEIAEITQTNRKEVKVLLTAIRNVIERHVMTKGSGEVTIPELGIKVRRVVKKATKARKGRNPFTGEEIQIPAKPARKSVKATALKTLKSILESA